MFQEGSHPPSRLDLLAWWWLSANVCGMTAVPQKVTELLSKGSPCSASLQFLGFPKTAHQPALPVGTMVFTCQFTYLLWHDFDQLSSIIGKTSHSPLVWLPSTTQPLSLSWHFLLHQGHSREKLVKVLYTLPAPHLTTVLPYAYILCFLTAVKDRLCPNSGQPCNLWAGSPSPLSYSRWSIM